jgi:hypothetical protein
LLPSVPFPVHPELRQAEAKDDDEWGHGFDEEALEEVDSDCEGDAEAAEAFEDAEVLRHGHKDEGTKGDGSGSSELKGASGGEVSPLRLGELSVSSPLSSSYPGSDSSLQQRRFKRTTSAGDRIGMLKLNLPPRKSSENLRAAAERCGSPMLSAIEVGSADGGGVDFAPRLTTPRTDSIPSKTSAQWSAPWELKEQDA